MNRISINPFNNSTPQDEILQLGVDLTRIRLGGDIVTTEEQCAMHSDRYDSLFRLFNQLSADWRFPISEARCNSIYVLSGCDPEYKMSSFDNRYSLHQRVSAISGLEKLLPPNSNSLSLDVQDDLLLIYGIKHLLEIQNKLRQEVEILNRYSGRILILGPQNTTTQRPAYCIFETYFFGTRDKYTSPRRNLSLLRERIRPIVCPRAKRNSWQDLPLRD